MRLINEAKSNSVINPIPRISILNTTHLLPCCQKQHRLVWGYIRRIAVQHKYMQIPSEINDIIYLFNGLTHKQIREFAKDFNKSLHKINTISITRDQNETIQGFTGISMLNHVKTYLNKHVYNLSDHIIISRCNDLLYFKYVQCVASTNTNISQPHPSSTNKGLDLTQKCVYQFANDKRREFVMEESPDRLAWTRTTKVEIYSESLGGWQLGTIVEIEEDLVTVTYGPPSQQMRKTIGKLMIT